MHAHGGQRSARRLRGGDTPIVRGNELSRAGGVLRHHGDHGAEPSLRQTLAEVDHGWMKAPAIPDRQHHARRSGGIDRAAGAGAVKRDRLLDVDVLARGGGRDDLRLVLAVGRGQHERVHVGIG